MKRISLLLEKSFKELKLWNYRTILMFLVISIIIFLLLLLVSGCKVDAAEYMWEKQFTTLPILKVNFIAPARATSGVKSITIINRENLANEADVNIFYHNNASLELINSTSTRIEYSSPDVVKNSAAIKVISSQA